MATKNGEKKMVNTASNKSNKVSISDNSIESMEQCVGAGGILLRLKRKHFIEGEHGDKLFTDYRKEFVTARYEQRKMLLEKWFTREMERVEEACARVLAATDPKEALKQRIARLQAKLQKM